ncbi:tautomerase family protein [Bradyrhizobium sp. 149]|uniref:tautomerase family protein n=1 Tax=Bradyrhizobium sp. 149 TaxID=2782624 RepID=UPI001FF907BA|nr:tautomerase family protein [Bradyrhizobium sp. 149]MCK1652081.1 tautomerase family protein [Bradyrhizobium sp. 149]
MPLARISVPAHLALAQIRALADAVHEGLVETCGVPPKDRFQLVSAYAPEMMLIDPTFPDVARTPDALIIEIVLLEGRTVDQKRNLFRRIADRAVRAGFSGDDVMIALTENAPADWSLGRGLGFGDNHAPMAASPASTR